MPTTVGTNWTQNWFDWDFSGDFPPGGPPGGYAGDAGVHLLDVNGDGFLDAVIPLGTSGADGRAGGDPTRAHILINNGTGVFTDRTSDYFSLTQGLTGSSSQQIVADFNGDGRMDLFLGDFGYDGDPFPGGQNALFLSDGAHGFVDASDRLPQLLDITHSACAADIDNDGDVDIFVGNLGSATNTTPPYFLINEGTGHFQQAVNRTPGMNVYTSTILVDANGDGFVDLVAPVAGNSPGVVRLNNGAGSFVSSLALPVPALGPHLITRDTSVVDVNGDGRLDVIARMDNDAGGPTYLQVLISNGDGTFHEENDRIPQANGLPMIEGTDRILHADLNGDGFTDIVTRGRLDRLILMNDGSGRYVEAPDSIFESVRDQMQPMNMAVGDVNGDGRTDMIGGYRYSNGGVVIVWVQNARPSTQTGDETGEALMGEATGDTLSGAGGADMIFGGAGNDVLDGGSDNDYVNGGAGVDTVLGGAGDDTLNGAAGDDWMDGGAGDDQLIGGAGGVNVLIGGDGLDSLSFAGSYGSLYVDLAGGAYAYAGGGWDALSSIEGVIGGGAADTILGDGNANRLLGGAEADLIQGRDGADTLRGEAGDDWLDGGAGDDALEGGAGINILIGGDGLDLASYASATAGLWIDVSAGVYAAAGVWDVFYQSIEGAIGGSGADYMIAAASGSTLRGEAGADTLIGRNGGDHLIGGAGSDWIVGGAGADRLDGGAGVDIYTAGAGADVFALGANAVWDVAFDFSTAEDRFDLAGNLWLGLVEADWDGDGQQDDTLLGYAGGNFVALNVSGLTLEQWNALVNAPVASLDAARNVSGPAPEALPTDFGHSPVFEPAWDSGGPEGWSLLG